MSLSKFLAKIRKLFHLGRRPITDATLGIHVGKRCESPYTSRHTSYDSYDSEFEADLRFRKTIRPYSPPISPRTPIPYSDYNPTREPAHVDCPFPDAASALNTSDSTTPADRSDPQQPETKRRGTAVPTARDPSPPPTTLGETVPAGPKTPVRTSRMQDIAPGAGQGSARSASLPLHLILEPPRMTGRPAYDPEVRRIDMDKRVARIRSPESIDFFNGKVVARLK
ncbi:hypothetical protein MBLNU459_g7987t1 [Dothideomycetes sp. NU459]